eukprot:114227_1
MSQRSEQTQAGPHRFVKYILNGDSKVGKSSILQRFAGEQVASEYKKTYCEEHKTRTIGLNEGPITIDIYDNRHAYDVGVDGFILVYDVAHKESLNNLTKYIHEIRKQYDQWNPMIMVLGNKSDLHKRSISFDEGQTFCDQHNIRLFYEISATTDTGILSQAIMRLTAKVINKQLKRLEKAQNRYTLTVNKLLVVSSVVCVAAIGLYLYRKQRNTSKD